MNKIDIIGQIADLKDIDYKTNLLLTSLIEILVEKKLFTKQELSLKAAILDLVSEAAIKKTQNLDQENIMPFQKHRFNKNDTRNNI